MKRSLLIYGAGGLGREVLSMVSGEHSPWDPIGFIDDSIKPGTTISGLIVRGGREYLINSGDPANIIIAVGNPVIKKTIVKSIGGLHLNFVSIIHPSVIIQQHSSVVIGKGCVLGAGSVLTTDIQVSDHVLLNLHVTIGHDVTIGSFSSIMPGVNIAGEVCIQEGVLIGSGANVINRVTIGNGAVIGMGAVVLDDVTAGLRVAGVPAKPI